MNETLDWRDRFWSNHTRPEEAEWPAGLCISRGFFFDATRSDTRYREPLTPQPELAPWGKHIYTNVGTGKLWTNSGTGPLYDFERAELWVYTDPICGVVLHTKWNPPF